MAVPTTAKTIKSSISFRKRNWDHLQNEKNRSKIVNQALDLYFEFQEKKQANYDAWYKGFIEETMEALDEVDRGECTPVPMKNGKIDHEAFEKELWS